MKILQLDVNSISYRLVKPEASVYEKTEEKEGRFENALVLLVTVEKGDTERTAEEAIRQCAAFASRQKIGTIVLYPFAHLSSSLEEPGKAIGIFKRMRESAKGVFEGRIGYAPFGWNKQLSLDIKGYPLAEQSRSYSDAGAKKTEEEEPSALEQEEKVRSTWYILDTDGSLIEADKFNFSKHQNLKKFADYEIRKERTYSKTPEHIRLMHKLKLVDYEPGSDPGNLRYYPNGRLVKSLLESYVTEKTIQYGAVEVETPIMYDYQHPAFKDYLARFPARHYVVRSDDKDFFLRFAACFGQFLIMHDTVISYRQLPLKVYELARYSFRRELSGELTGLKRLRAFTMPDMHTVCRDLPQARDEFGRQFDLCSSVLENIGIGHDDYETAIRFTEQFWNENKDFVQDIVKSKLGKPALIEMWSFRYAYFDPKFEFNVVDSMGKATALSTVQIDHENSERYKITYVSESGESKNTTILHCSPSGAIERVMYGLLELTAMRAKKGDIASLPLWLAPTQARLLPITDRHVGHCTDLQKRLLSMGVRADVDDTNETLDKKIRNAETEWVPYIVVIGDKEVSTGELSVRIREGKRQEKTSIDALAKEISDKTKGMPKAPLSLPALLSKRPIFPG